jgi:hypothetical protein
LPHLLALGLAAGALFCFIAALADVRRVNNALRHARVQVEHYATRAQGRGVLPLNLEPKSIPQLGRSPGHFEWITTAEAIELRQSSGPVLVAWSEPVFRLFGQDGRAVVRFEIGHFEARWMTSSEFEQARAAQTAELERLRSGQAP